MTPRASYGSATPKTFGGGLIACVDTGGAAERAGLRAGDVLIEANGMALSDVLDWRWAADGPLVEVTLVRAGSPARASVTLEREPGETWGVDFADAVFDGVRTCRNRCAFCFMAQLPKGLRRALYLRDDDFRLSFLSGNFITLTNLSDADVARIAEQRLSPLYVSLHAVDLDVRIRLVCAREDRALARFDELLAAGIDLHVQVVLVPGVNDGAALDRTLTWLAEREGVLSVGIVPLGFTAHQERFAASFGTPEAARAVIEQVGAWQAAFQKRDGITWVYLADEFYLNAGLEVPPAETYDGFPQYENGIGLVRAFLDEAAELRPRLLDAIARLPHGATFALVTGELFAPTLREVLTSLGAGDALRVLAAPNRFFGGNVSVTGLLTAEDILATIAENPGFDAYLVPDVVANADGLLLDDAPALELAKRSGEDVRLLSCDAGGLLAALEALAADPLPSKEE